MTPEPTGRPVLSENNPVQQSAKGVFINCPFDAEFKVRFQAVIFATVCCGFLPRSALESGTVSDSRMTRIVEAIFSSRYSIHDLTRCTGEGAENFARFNMPLELGMAMAARIVNRESGHDWLALAPRGHGYQKFISDLAGYDLETYDESVAGIVGAVMRWLATRPDAVPPPTPHKVVDALPSFVVEVERLETEWHGYPPWPNLIEAAVAIARTID